MSVSVQNRSTAPVVVDSAVVSLTADKGSSGVGTTAGDPHPLKGGVAPAPDAMRPRSRVPAAGARCGR